MNASRIEKLFKISLRRNTGEAAGMSRIDCHVSGGAEEKIWVRISNGPASPAAAHAAINRKKV